ncbi:MAG: HAD-IA family hydrolase [Planctomycetes bacterium]|nr:HAD-IA family hydrolase [Planctomycetota bacterium]
MAQKTIKAVLFDLGDTLVNFGKVDRATIFMEAARTSYDYLKRAGQPVGNFRLYVWRNVLGMRAKTALSEIIGRDFDSLEVIKYSGSRQGWKLSDEQWEDVNKCWYEPLRRRGRIEVDLAETLGKLRDAGLKLGIVSNTFVHACSLDAHLGELGILDFFPLRIYSYQLKFRKPDKRIFLEAAKRLSVEPEETLFVGDRINKDVKGAIRAGMVPVLKSAYTSEGKRLDEGVLKIDKIAELPEIIAGMNN